MYGAVLWLFCAIGMLSFFVGAFGVGCGEYHVVVSKVVLVHCVFGFRRLVGWDFFFHSLFWDRVIIVGLCYW